MSEENKNKVKEKTKNVKEKTVGVLASFLSNNDYRSDLIIAVILLVTMYLYDATSMGDQAFVDIMRLGMSLVALEYLGEKIINKFL
jgi:hypothetical protein